MIHVLDQSEKVVGLLTNINPDAPSYWNDKHVEKDENSLNTYEFTCAEENEVSQHLVVKNKIVIRDLDGFFIPFTIERVNQTIMNGKRVKLIECEAGHMELRTTKIIDPMTLSGATVNTAADTLLGGTRWKRGITEYSGLRTLELKEYMSCLKALHQMASEFEIKLRFKYEIKGNKVINRYVDFLKPNEAFGGKEIVLGKDLKGIERVESSTDIFTALYGIGQGDSDGKFVTFESVNNGSKWVGDNAALYRWTKDGKHLFGIYLYQGQSGKTPTPQEVLNATKEALKKSIESVVQYKVDPVVLERISGLTHEKVRKGDIVRIKDEKFNPPIYLEATVLEVERSYTTNDRDLFVLGNYNELKISKSKSITDLQSFLFRNANSLLSKATVYEGTSEPEDKTNLWIDTSGDIDVWKRWDGETWKKATPTTATEVGAETPTGAQTKASAAETNAKNYAKPAIDDTTRWKVPGKTTINGAHIEAQTILASHIKSLNGLDVGNGQFVVDGNGNVFIGGYLNGASGTFSGDLLADRVLIKNPDYDVFGGTTIALETGFISANGEFYTYDGTIEISSWNRDLTFGKKSTSGAAQSIPVVTFNATNFYVNGTTTLDEVYADGWFRARGQRGILFQDYGGGWYMIDTTWIRNYGSKPLLMNNVNGEIVRLDYSTNGYLTFHKDGVRDGYIGSGSTTNNNIYLLADRGDIIIQRPNNSTILTVKESLNHAFFAIGQAGFKSLSSVATVQVRKRDDSDYAPLDAASFNPKSSVKYKDDVKDTSFSFLEKVKGTKVKEYVMKSEKRTQKRPKKRYGLIVEEAPEEIISDSGDGINLYTMATFLWKAVQELAFELSSIWKVVKEMQDEIKKLKKVS